MSYLPNKTWVQNATSFDAWGRPKVYLDYSLFHGMWTHDLARDIWKITEGVNWLTCDLTPTNVVSIAGRLQVDSGAIAGDVAVIQSRRNPKYQPNRGHLYSTALGLPNPTGNGVREWGLGQCEGTTGDLADNGAFFRLKADGVLYAVIRSGGTDTHEEAITLPVGFELDKGNLYDIQFQWRGVGNYNFMVSNPANGHLELVHTITFVNTLSESLSLQRPALAAFFRAKSLGDNVRIWAGCVDITSEGGEGQHRIYGSIATTKGGVTLPTNAEYALVAVKINSTFNGKLNTRDAILKRILMSVNNEAEVALYKTCDASLFIGTTWSNYNGSDNIQYSIGTDLVADLVGDNMKPVLKNRIEQDVLAKFDNPAPEADYWLTPGDYLVISVDASSGNSAWSTIEFVQEI